MYQRPAIGELTFLDVDGTPIPYGHRWHGSPPDDAYSRTSNTQRYRPLHDVADALVAWASDAFDVTVEEVPVEEGTAGTTAERIVLLTPREETAAPLRVEFTDFPGVIVRAGALASHIAPHCGCDACDEDVLSAAEDLEQFVFAVVGGRFAERVGTESPEWVETDLEFEGGSSSGGSRRDDLDVAQLAEADARIPPGGRWSPWT